jgi:multidrug efflux pump subunit AcrB
LALFGAVLFTFLRAYNNNIYAQIGLVLLIGLASKTAILLVEFAKQHHEQGHSILESAVAAARLRFRPILMTALSFVSGVVPLAIATGAGSAGRRALGTAVFGGMLVATILGILCVDSKTRRCDTAGKKAVTALCIWIFVVSIWTCDTG